MTIEWFKETLRERGLEVESALGECLKGKHIPCDLLTAMDYSLLAGGKRLRPVLCLTLAELFGLERDKAMPFACAIECIHTYSLIHDDLPAMDDDDLRRGKPSNHVQHGEATAILAGDGLLTEAFGLMAATAPAVPHERVLTALAEMARAAGGGGMVGGQALDMLFTGRTDVGLEELRGMHAMKTGALIRASCLCGAMLAGAGDKDLERVAEYGRALGAAFQIADDILDEVGDEAQLGKPVGSDQDQGKVTYPSLLGLDKSRELAQGEADKAAQSLEGYEGDEARFLTELAQYVVTRVS